MIWLLPLALAVLLYVLVSLGAKAVAEFDFSMPVID